MVVGDVDHNLSVRGPIAAWTAVAVGLATSGLAVPQAFLRFVTGLLGPPKGDSLLTMAEAAVLFILANAWIVSLPGCMN